ncbi:hypothetical protein [Streptomyces sp. NBC_00829]|nr:hypothetical protein OG293_11720 [Streptomyces sp. NBC_00829]
MRRTRRRSLVGTAVAACSLSLLAALAPSAAAGQAPDGNPAQDHHGTTS